MSDSNEIRIVVADDSGLMRLIISDILNSEQGFKVVDTAVDGKDAVEKVLKQEVDVLVLDMNMGDFDGKYAIEHILAKKNVPILILSAIGNTNMDPILEALRMGAVDYLNKPEKNKAKVREVSEELIAKVWLAAKANKRQIATARQPVKINNQSHTFDTSLNYDVIVIGASTGGPSAVEKVIANLPANLPVPVIVAQHMPANFVPSFANRLNTISALEVTIGRKDDELLPGKVIIVSGSRNSFIKRNEQNKVVIDFTSQTFSEFNYPSINCLFLSVAEVYGERTIAAILTGMGKDGADGMQAIFNKGGFTIAQDKETSVVYGMPKAVADRGLAKQSVPINQMAGFIVSCLS